MVQLVVHYLDDTARYFPIHPLQGWKIDATYRMLVVGKGIPRTHIPLDRVAYFEILERGE